MKSYIALSLSDLILVQGFAEAFSDKDTKRIHKILFQNGMNIKDEEGVEEVIVNHRNLQGKEINCLVYRGTERTDKEWLNSGAATLEAYMASADTDTQKDMIRMSRRYNNYEHVERVGKGSKSDKN